jgi:hypothetical protein
MFTISVLFFTIILSGIISKIDCVLIDRLLVKNESNDCLTLCDHDIKVDAITPINLSAELLLISGKCAFIIDPTKFNSSQIKHGFKHSFAFTEIQDMFAIGNKTDIEFVSVYVSCLHFK